MHAACPETAGPFESGQKLTEPAVDQRPRTAELAQLAVHENRRLVPDEAPEIIVPGRLEQTPLDQISGEIDDDWITS